MSTRTLGRILWAAALSLCLLGHAFATDDSPARLPAGTTGTWRTAFATGHSLDLWDGFEPSISEIDWQVLKFGQDQVQLLGGSTPRSAQIVVHPELKSGLPDGIVFDLMHDGKSVRGALYLNGDKMGLRFPETARCSRSGALITLKRAADEAVKVTVAGQLVRSPNAFSANIPYLAVDDSLFRLKLPEGSLEAIADLIGQRVNVSGSLQLEFDQPQKDGRQKTDAMIEVATLVDAEHQRTIIDSSPNGTWRAIVHHHGIKLYNVASGRSHQVMEPMSPSPASAIDWTVRTKFSQDGRRLTMYRGLEHETLDLLTFQRLAKPKRGWLKSLQPVATLPHEAADHTLELLQDVSPNGKYANYAIHAYGKSPAKAIGFFDVEEGDPIALIPIDGADQTSVTYSANGQIAVVEVRASTFILQLANGRVTEIH